MVDIRHRLQNRSNKDIIPMEGLAVTYKDIFSWEYLYFMVHEWLLEQGYCSADADFRETFFGLREAQASEVIVRWRLSKAPGTMGPFNDQFFSVELDIDFHILGLKETQVTVGSRKLGANTGEVEVKIAGRLIIHKDKMKDELWLRRLIEFTWKQPFNNRISAHKRLLISDMSRLQETLKAYFKLETYLDDPRFNQFYMNATMDNF